MASGTESRNDALSRERIVEAAIAILDNEGEGALTFRVLAARLGTGSGAIFRHVADKSDLLAAATSQVIAHVTAEVGDADSRDAIRAIALGAFDAIDVHPWVGTQLSREPWQPAMGDIFESVGSRLHALGVPECAQFDAASAIVNCVLAAAAQNTAAARFLAPDADREAFLTAVSGGWMEADPAKYPFVSRMRAKLRDHDDRQQYLAGVDLILAGIATLTT